MRNSNTQYKLFASALSDVARRIGITFRPLYGLLDKNQHQQWTNIDGNQSKRLLQKLCEGDTLRLLLMFQSNEETMVEAERDHRVKYFYLFLKMFTGLNYIQKFLASAKARSDEEIETFQAHSKELYRVFVDLDKKNVSKWYLHMLVAHVGDQLKQEKTIAPYSCSAQERVNSQHYRMLQTCVQYHSSSKQLLQSKRMQCMYEYVLIQYQRDKRFYPAERRSSPTKDNNGERSVPLTEEQCGESLPSRPRRRKLSRLL